jgi:uncharacterized protein
LNRQGDWIQTSKGRQFWPFDPRVGDFDIEEIAHALSNLCRFGGHCSEFYSVAQHSALVSDLLPPEHKLAGLMHDAAEAYIVDIPRPIKYSLPGYLEAEHKIESVLAEQYGLQYPWHLAVKEADNIALMTEARDLMHKKPMEWGIAESPHPDEIWPVSPYIAELRFLTKWRELTRGEAVVAR